MLSYNRDKDKLRFKKINTGRLFEESIVTQNIFYVVLLQMYLVRNTMQFCYQTKFDAKYIYIYIYIYIHGHHYFQKRNAFIKYSLSRIEHSRCMRFT